LLQAAEELGLPAERARAEPDLRPDPSPSGCSPATASAGFGIPVLLGRGGRLRRGRDGRAALRRARRRPSASSTTCAPLLARRVDGIIVVGERHRPAPVDQPRPARTRRLRLRALGRPRTTSRSCPTDVRGAPHRRPAPADHRPAAHRPHHRAHALQGRPGPGGRHPRGAGRGGSHPLPAGRSSTGRGHSGGGAQAAEITLTADPEVDAVVCGSDQIAAGFVEAARERGIGSPTTSRSSGTTTGRSCPPRPGRR
jgi:LacI family transcriptional regulator